MKPAAAAETLDQFDLRFLRAGGIPPDSAAAWAGPAVLNAATKAGRHTNGAARHQRSEASPGGTIPRSSAGR